MVDDAGPVRTAVRQFGGRGAEVQSAESLSTVNGRRWVGVPAYALVTLRFLPTWRWIEKWIC